MKAKTLIPLIHLACLLAVTAMAQVNYAVSGGSAYVTNSPNASGNIVIASTYHGKPVTSIEDAAFDSCTALTSVTIPSSVTSIGYQAFAGCTGLSSVTIPNSVTSIGVAAFDSCTALTSVTIPNSVTGIGGFAFHGCTGLTNFSVDAANVVYSSLDGVFFNKAQTTLFQFPGGRGGGYAIPSSVSRIWEFAFYSCADLTNVTIPNSVTNIEVAAFDSCTSLATMTIPDSVTSIGSYAFYSCTGLTSLTFLGNAPTEGSRMFANVGPSATVYYYSGTAGWGPTYGGLPTVMLAVPAPQVAAASAGVKPGGFGFAINGVLNQTIVVEASTDLTNWQSIWTNTLSAGATNFVDPQWLNHPRRFYRARSN